MNRIFALAFMVVAALAHADAVAVRFVNCKSNFQIKEVQVNPCEGGDASRCGLKKGTSPSISVKFVPDRTVTNLTATVYGIVASIPTEFTLPNSLACHNSGITCPLQAGQEYTYTASVPILPIYPSMQLLIRWQLDSTTPTPVAEGAEKKYDVCFTIRAKIVD